MARIAILFSSELPEPLQDYFVFVLWITLPHQRELRLELQTIPYYSAAPFCFFRLFICIVNCSLFPVLFFPFCLCYLDSSFTELPRGNFCHLALNVPSHFLKATTLFSVIMLNMIIMKNNKTIIKNLKQILVN